MKNRVGIFFNTKAINVDGERYNVENLSLDLIIDKLPSDVNFGGVQSMGWSEVMNPTSKGYIALASGGIFEFGEDRYNDYIQPYVDLWQVEKNKHDQEIAEFNSFPVRKARALNQLNLDFEIVKERAHIKSSLGFEADANQTAKENVDGLLVTIGEGEVQFCDYNNQFHTLNKIDLEVLQTEIIQNAQYLYQQKWSYRTQIEECADGESLDKILAQIEFEYKDFTQ